jgi:hypothetical protein
VVSRGEGCWTSEAVGLKEFGAWGSGFLKGLRVHFVPPVGQIVRGGGPGAQIVREGANNELRATCGVKGEGCWTSEEVGQGVGATVLSCAPRWHTHRAPHPALMYFITGRQLCHAPPGQRNIHSN